MRRRLTCILIGFFIFASLTGLARAQAKGSLALLVEGEPYTSEGPPELADGEVFIPLRVFVAAFGAQLRWLADEQGYLISMGGQEISLRAGETTISVNGREFKLHHAPRVINSRTMVPFELVAGFLPLAATWNERTGQLDLRRPVNEMTSLQAGFNDQGRPIIAVDSRDDLGSYQIVGDLCKPSRIVLDFYGMKPQAGLAIKNDGNPLVRGMRVETPTANRTRLVVDLSRPVAYELVSFPGETDHVELHFDYALRDVRLVEDGGWPGVVLDVGKSAEYRTFVLQNPERVVIDLVNTVCSFSKSKIAGDGRVIKGMRISQMDKNTTRVVLDMAAPRPYRVFRASANGVLSVDFPKRITSAAWSGGALVFEGESILQARVTPAFSQAGATLNVSIANAVFAEGLAVQGSEATVARVDLANGGEGTANAHLTMVLYGGYRVTASNGRTKLQLVPSALIGKTIVVDAGHGGPDSGALSPAGLREKDINLDVAIRLMWRLKAAGADVVMTRSDDTFVGLYDRPKLANDVEAAAFISIHSNLHPTDPYVRGIETYHHPAKADSARLAQIIHAELLRMSGLYDRKVKTRSDFVVIRDTQMPSLLLEIGFLSNAGDAHLLATEAYHETVADAVLSGLFQFFGPGEIRNPAPTLFGTP